MKFITSSFCFYKIKLKEIFESEKQLFLILELVTGGELFDRLEFYFNSESWHNNLVFVIKHSLLEII